MLHIGAGHINNCQIILKLFGYDIFCNNLQDKKISSKFGDIRGINYLHFYLFADDTNIYFEAEDLKTLQKIMNRELRHVKKWLEANKLALNIKKTNFVVFHSLAKMLTEPVTLKFGRKKITHANHVKLLGVLLDETPSWRSYLIELSR